MQNILKNTSVLIMGGTRGLGKALGIEFARVGAKVFLTHRWGSVDQNELLANFKQVSDIPPEIIEADAGDHDAIVALMEKVKKNCKELNVIIHSVAFSKVVHKMEDLKRQSLELSLKYSSWPLVDLLQTSKSVLGKYPSYAIAVSSDGAEQCHPKYEMVGCSKAVLETLCRYLAIRLKDEGVKVNAIRPGLMDTESLRAVFGETFVKNINQKDASLFLDPHKVAKTCVALCSGLMDAVTGQVLTVDEGSSLMSPINYFLDSLAT